jgi:four helix bundle protein
MKDIIAQKADLFVHQVYKASKSFPKEELYGITSQLRRASISVVLNIIEGYARGRRKEHIHFLETSYASLKEVKYLLYFSYREEYLNQENYNKLLELSEEIARLLWTKIKTMKK